MWRGSFRWPSRPELSAKRVATPSETKEGKHAWASERTNCCECNRSAANAQRQDVDHPEVDRPPRRRDRIDANLRARVKRSEERRVGKECRTERCGCHDRKGEE